MGSLKGIKYLVKRYIVVVTLPTFTTACIYADWNHTRQWKAQLAEQEKEGSKN